MLWAAGKQANGRLHNRGAQILEAPSTRGRLLYGSPFALKQLGQFPCSAGAEKSHSQQLKKSCNQQASPLDRQARELSLLAR